MLALQRLFRLPSTSYRGDPAARAAQMSARTAPRNASCS